VLSLSLHPPFYLSPLRSGERTQSSGQCEGVGSFCIQADTTVSWVFGNCPVAKVQGSGDGLRVIPNPNDHVGVAIFRRRSIHRRSMDQPFTAAPLRPFSTDGLPCLRHDTSTNHSDSVLWVMSLQISGRRLASQNVLKHVGVCLLIQFTRSPESIARRDRSRHSPRQHRFPKQILITDHS
jgi:hypothetical protein